LKVDLAIGADDGCFNPRQFGASFAQSRLGRLIGFRFRSLLI